MTKALAIIFCGNDTDAAKAFAASLRNGENSVTLADAYSFNRNEEDGHAYIMPDVPGWHRDRIAAAYPISSDVPPTKANREPFPAAALMTVKHRGRGKFYIMRGQDIISGPHTKDEAKRLTAQG